MNNTDFELVLMVVVAKHVFQSMGRGVVLVKILYRLQLVNWQNQAQFLDASVSPG